MAALGVGLIGTGYMGKCHALAWNNVTSVFGDVERPRLVTLAEVNPELAAKKAAEFGFARSTRKWQWPPWRPANMSGAKNRWRPLLPMR
jgi:predicted dehydrogenase